MTYPITPLYTTDARIPPSSSPDAQVDQLEKEADAEAHNFPEAERAAYRTMIRREVAQIRSIIAQMRAQGFSENPINAAIGELSRKFYESKNRFLEGNRQFALDKARVVACNQATAEKIRQCTPDFSPLNGTSSEQRKYRLQAAMCVGSRKIWNFNAGDKRPKLLFVVGKDNEYGALNPLDEHNCKILRDLNAEYNVKYVAVSNVEGVYDELKQLPKKSLSGLIIFAHGSPYAINFDAKWDGTFKDTQAAAALKDKAFVHLFSCSTGSIDGVSPLYRLQDSLGTIVQDKKVNLSAPKAPLMTENIEFLSKKPLKFRYSIPGSICRLMEQFEGELHCRDLPDHPSERGKLESTCSLSTDKKIN